MKKSKMKVILLTGLMALSCMQIVGYTQVSASEKELKHVTGLLANEKLSSGVVYTEEDITNYKDGNDRLRINHLTIDPNDKNTQIISKKDKDTVNARNTVLAQAQEETAKGNNIVAGINADSFDIDCDSGISRSINVYDGYILQSQPYDNYNKCNTLGNILYKYQSVLYIDSSGNVKAGPLNSNAHFTAGSFGADVTPLNRNDFTWTAQNEGYRAFTSAVTKDHILRYVNSRNASSGLVIPKTIRYAVIQIDEVNGTSFDGYIKAGHQYTGNIIEIKKTDNFRISDNAENKGISADEFQIPNNCIVIAGYTTKLETDVGYSDTKAARIENLNVGQSITYQCDLYSGYGFSTSNNGGTLNGIFDSDLRTDVVSAVGGFNTLALNGIANTKNNNHVMKRGSVKTARTMVGITKDNKIHMLTVASKSASMRDSDGISYEDITDYMMDELGCEDVLSMDGGGSTTMVARRAGEKNLSVVNYPSDGSQRLVGNSLLVVNTSDEAPSDTVSQVVLGADKNIYKNSPYRFNVKLTDANGNPIDTAGKEINYTANMGKIDKDGLYIAPSKACKDTVTATVDGVSESITVNVKDTFLKAGISPNKIALTKGDIQQFELTAYDASNQRIYIAPSSVTWSLSDSSVGSMKNGLLTVSAKKGKSDVSATFEDKIYKTKIYIGLTEQVIEDFETTPDSAYHLSGYMYGALGDQRGGRDNNGAGNTYIGYETKGTKGSIVKNGKNSLRITGITSDWENRKKNGTMNILPDWDAAHPEFGFKEQQRAVLEDDFTAKVLPEKFGMWVYSCDADKDGVSDNADCILMANFLQNCPGSKVSGYDLQPSWLKLSTKVDWIGWKWVEVNIPQTWDMPVVFNYMSLINTNKTLKTDQTNEIIIDDLKFIYSSNDPINDPIDD